VRGVRRAHGLIARGLSGAVCLAALLCARGAAAYRPFDGTDADTAELGEFELELGPAHYFRLGPQNYLIAPNTVLNFGLLPRTELVIDASQYVALGPLSPGVSRDSLLDDDVLVKHTFREGTLQGKTGPSIAAEGGLLTPEVNGGAGSASTGGSASIGASIDVITSYRWAWGTIHYNEWFEFNRAHDADLFTGLIVEGPAGWRVRPVGEAFVEEEFVLGPTESLLLGAIWTVRESFVLDAGVRAARVVDENALEVRLGLTWSVPMWGAKEPEPVHD
jgi:hypothetical protein